MDIHEEMKAPFREQPRRAHLECFFSESLMQGRWQLLRLLRQEGHMVQMSFSAFEYAGKRKQARRERFLAEMEQNVRACKPAKAARAEYFAHTSQC